MHNITLFSESRLPVLKTVSWHAWHHPTTDLKVFARPVGPDAHSRHQGRRAKDVSVQYYAGC